MATIRELLKDVKIIQYSSPSIKVERTVSQEVAAGFSPNAQIKQAAGLGAAAGTMRIAVVVNEKDATTIDAKLKGVRDWMMVRTQKGGGIELYASRPHLLYNVFCTLSEEWLNADAEAFRNGKILFTAFPQLRPVYDLFLIQHARSVRNFDKHTYIKELARNGFSHVEVNGLAFPVPFEQGPKGELLHRFYTYCPALDQFVSSRLNKGFYDDDYLQANLNHLKTNAEIAEQYGLTPGLVCFEPRSVPDELLQRYPHLRGARVDHPMRSFKPRYNLSTAHPVVLEHYAEMVDNLVKEVPALDYLSIWSNDSGAGFEYTSSLYVGRNGGGYVIREWKGEEEIAESAADNLVRYLRTLRDAGRKTNPKFRTLIRLEPFWREHDHIWKQLEDGIDVEVSSLQTKGWGLSYKHPKYDDAREIHGTALYNRFVEAERPLIEELQNKGSHVDVYFTPGIIWNHEPLIGISFPWLVYDKLKDMAAQKVETACSMGGGTPLSFAPYNINQELVRAFQQDKDLDLEAFLLRKATEWVGATLAKDLIAVWRHSDEAFRSYPIPIWIYSGWGNWYRLFVRPIVPDVERISEDDRAYYEKFLLATSHNRCRIDFRYDVGFDLVDPEHAWKCVRYIDENLFPELKKSIALLRATLDGSVSEEARKCLVDQLDRCQALYCWYRTQRNVTAWVAGVHTYLESKDSKIKDRSRALLKEMVLDEIENTKELLHLWETSKTNWMILSEVGETTFIYYKNFGDLLKRKIELMKGHEDDEPKVDMNFQWRVPGFTDRNIV